MAVEGEKTKAELKKIKLLASGALFYHRLIDKTMRKVRTNYTPECESAIYAIWHGWQYGLLVFNKKQRKNLNILISQSNDGEIIAQVCDGLGFSLIRGSHKRGGVKALFEIIKALKKGQSLAYTVDGPKGPVFEVKPGIIKIAQMSKVPIIPLVPFVTKKVEVKSWDKYRIPLPFSSVSFAFGEPIYIPEKLDDEQIEEYRSNLEKELFRIEQVAKNAATSTYINK